MSHPSTDGYQGGSAMIYVEDSVMIKRPVEEVFAYIADQTNAPRWQKGLIEVRRVSDGPIGTGTRHTAVRKFLGRRTELTNEYVRFEPNQVITFTAQSGPMRLLVSYMTEPLGDAVKVTCQMQMEQGGLYGLADPLIAGSIKRESKADFLALKALLEQKVG
jgi:uncharacterized membrane protein